MERERFLDPDLVAGVFVRLPVRLVADGRPLLLAPVFVLELRRRPLAFFAVVFALERDADEDFVLDAEVFVRRFEPFLPSRFALWLALLVELFRSARLLSARLPEPLFLPPPSFLLTVAQAMRSAACSDRPLLRAEASMCRA